MKAYVEADDDDAAFVSATDLRMATCVSSRDSDFMEIDKAPLTDVVRDEMLRSKRTEREMDDDQEDRVDGDMVVLC